MIIEFDNIIWNIYNLINLNIYIYMYYRCLRVLYYNLKYILNELVNNK